MGKISKRNPNKIQENFCKGLDFGIRTQMCSYIQVLRLHKSFFVISIFNLSIPFLILLIQSNNLFSKNNFQDQIWYSQSRGRILPQSNSIRGTHSKGCIPKGTIISFLI